jgi:hypothetical protein
VIIAWRTQDKPAVARTWFSRALVHAQLHDVRRRARNPESRSQSSQLSSKVSSPASKASAKKAAGLGKTSRGDQKDKKGQQGSGSGQAPAEGFMIPLTSGINFPVWTLATQVYKQ